MIFLRDSHSLRLPAAAAAAALILAACMTRPPAPVSERVPPPPEVIETVPPATVEVPSAEAALPPTHVVKRGETLYQIALDHGLDYRELAAWNNIENVNVIRTDRVLVLAPPGEAGAAAASGGAVTTPLAAAPPIAPVGSEARTLPFTGATPSGRGNTAAFKSEPKALKLPYSEQALAQMQQSNAIAPSPSAPPSVAAPPAPLALPAGAANAPEARPASPRVPEIDGGNVDWAWPAIGKVVSGFSESANLKGIDIAGKAGQPIFASGAGKVVYAGNGLRGYGKLIIIKHNSTFLSAYAHNREILVKEGQQVAKGQKIAEMGDTDADRVALHFEIRRFGKPVDPAKFLPPA
ncbi:MAG: peptidoglycan DD-metalloendopeptidase family protein [Casimicrobiaceae bacterium]